MATASSVSTAFGKSPAGEFKLFVGLGLLAGFPQRFAVCLVNLADGRGFGILLSFQGRLEHPEGFFSAAGRDEQTYRTRS